jgi:hypothetical protein
MSTQRFRVVRLDPVHGVEECELDAEQVSAMEQDPAYVGNTSRQTNVNALHDPREANSERNSLLDLIAEADEVEDVRGVVYLIQEDMQNRYVSYTLEQCLEDFPELQTR